MAELKPHDVGMERFEKNQASPPRESRIKKFLEKIGDVSAECGINEHVRCHILNKIISK
ncbi:MAG: hypothetical protein AB1796_01255 [Bacillota bacterium]